MWRVFREVGQTFGAIKDHFGEGSDFRNDIWHRRKVWRLDFSIESDIYNTALEVVRGDFKVCGSKDWVSLEREGVLGEAQEGELFQADRNRAARAIRPTIRVQSTKSRKVKRVHRANSPKKGRWPQQTNHRPLSAPGWGHPKLPETFVRLFPLQITRRVKSQEWD